jgi:hypothetical protein
MLELLTAPDDGQTVTYSVYVVVALYKELFAMLGHLVYNRGADARLDMHRPLLPALMRALAALFRRR